jgi:hypothetical protein
LSQKDQWLPVSRHAKDLLIHAEELVKEDSERGLKIGLILVDNGVEVMLREYQRYRKELPQAEVEKMMFHKLLDSCLDLSIVSSSKSHFQFCHDTRNLLYHNGSLMPTKEDVFSFLSFAKELFNELHPNHRLSITKLEQPTSKTAKQVRNFTKEAYMNEVYFSSLFSESLEKQGYEIRTNSPVYGARTSRFDMVARKGDSFIIIEFKQNVRAVTGVTLAKLSTDKALVEKASPDVIFSVWLVANGTFSEMMRRKAASYEVELIDDTNISDYTKDWDG